MTEKKNHPIKSRDLAIGLFVSGFLVGGVGGYMRHTGQTVPEWALGGVIVAAVLASVWYWRRLDETAKEAHKFSWYWGSTAGIFTGLILFALTTIGLDIYWLFQWVLPDRASDGYNERDVFFLGAYMMFLIQLIGYVIVWAVWWLRMR